jgi:hypothetical protein
LRRKINLALISLRENGSYQQIYDKGFGTRSASQVAGAAIAISVQRHTVELVAERRADIRATSRDARVVAKCLDRSAVGDQRPQFV